MHLPRILTALTLSALALPALAADYLTYNLSTGDVTTFTADAANVNPAAYRGDTMLFIKSPDNIWLGALEVTQKQAKTLGFDSATDAEAAYTRAPGPAIPNLPQDILRYPTKDELTAAWGEELPLKKTDSDTLSQKYNLLGLQGISVTTPAAWGSHTPNDYGYYDLLGNVAEYVTSGTKLFIGGCYQTEYFSRASNFTSTPTDSTNDTCGFRLVYIGPEEKTYTVTVDGKKIVSAVPGETVTFTPAVPAGQYIASWATSPEAIAKELNGEGEETFTMPEENVTIDYTYKPYYKTTVVIEHVGGETTSTTDAECKAGASVTPDPKPEFGYRIDGDPTFEPAVESWDGVSFTMPEGDVTVTYAAKPYVTLTVTGGTVSETEPFMGSSVTLTPKPGAHQVFKSWAVSPTGLTLNGNTLSIPKTGLTPGAAYAATASFETAPRVLVYGGTVTVTAGEDLGNGYYSLGARLLFEADIPSGCKLAGWKTEDETALRTDNAYTVPTDAANTTKTFTAVFEISDTAVGGEATLHFGLEENGAAYGNFGYKAEKAESESKGTTNILHYPVYTEETGDYALFTLTGEGALAFSSTLPTGGDDDTPSPATTSVLPLKRVKPAEGAPFYLGVYETSNAHVAYLFGGKNPDDADYDTAKKTEYDGHTGNAYAYVMEGNDRDWVRGPFAGDTPAVLQKLDERFLTALNTISRLPTKEEIIAAAGKGAKLDLDEEGKERIQKSMVNSPGTSFYTASGVAVNVDGKVVDPYGFYNMWGNYLESLGDGTATGGKKRTGVTGGYASNIFNECNTKFSDAAPRAWAISFRPLIPVTEPITVTVRIGENDTTVQLLPGKTIVRENEAPVLAGYEFQGWQWLDGTPVTAETTAAAEDDRKTLEAVFTPRSLREIAMTYEGCTGPENLIAGSSTTVYTEGTIDTFTVTEGLTAEPNADGTALTVTAPADSALTEAKVTVTLKDGTPAKPGYRFRLR